MKKRNLLLVILAVLLVFGLVVGCGPAEELIDVKFTGLDANGTDGTTTTTTLTLTFDVEIEGLASGDITVTGATKGALGGSGTTITVGISNPTSDKVTVKVSKSGYSISPSSKEVTIKLSASDKVALTAADYFNKEFQATYMLSGDSTNEFVTVTKTTFTIEEKQNTTSIDKLVFTIDNDGWEKLTTINTTVTDADPSGRGKFTVGYKIKGKITSSTSGYLPSNKTTPGFVTSDINTTPCWVYIYFADWVDGGDTIGYLCVRSPFYKATANTEGTLLVTGSESTPVVRVYKIELD